MEIFTHGKTELSDSELSLGEEQELQEQSLARAAMVDKYFSIVRDEEIDACMQDVDLDMMALNIHPKLIVHFVRMLNSTNTVFLDNHLFCIQYRGSCFD